MSFVFRINEELAVISIVAAELLSVSRSIRTVVKQGQGLNLFCDIASQINRSFDVVDELFSTFGGIRNERCFEQEFDRQFLLFKEQYQWCAGKPRKYCDGVYDLYLELLKTKEAKSGFPMLKRSFTRLDSLYDKWITNDVMLAMSIDGVAKLLNRLLTEVAELKQKDPEEAFIVLSSAFDDFAPYLGIIRGQASAVDALVGVEQKSSQVC